MNGKDLKNKLMPGIAIMFNKTISMYLRELLENFLQEFRKIILNKSSGKWTSQLELCDSKLYFLLPIMEDKQ
jgi:hypothetical protein